MLIFHSYVSLPEGKNLDPGNCGRWWKMHMPSWDYDMDYEPLTGMPIGIVVTLNICYYVLPLGKKGGYPSTPLVINQRIWKGYLSFFISASTLGGKSCIKLKRRILLQTHIAPRTHTESLEIQGCLFLQDVPNISKHQMFLPFWCYSTQLYLPKALSKNAAKQQWPLPRRMRKP